MSNPGEINYFFKKNYQSKNRDLRETCVRNVRDMEEVQKSHVLKVEELSRKNLTIMQLRARIQEFQNEVHCMNDSRDFKDAESVRSGPSHVPSQPALFPPYRDPGGLLSRNNQPPDIWNSQGISGNDFVNPPASSSSLCPGGFNPWSSDVSEHTSPQVMSESQTPVQDQRYQSGPSAKNSVIPSEGRFSKKLWGRPTTTADLGTSL